MALLDKARYDLDQTVVRAPTDGYVPQVVLRPGTMATATRLIPLMAFVSDEQPTLIASFEQKVISEIKPGMAGRGGVQAVPRADVQGEGPAGADGHPRGRDRRQRATPHGHVGALAGVHPGGLRLRRGRRRAEPPVGSQASIAIYTDRVHALSILRKIIMRIHSWENYVF